MLKRKQYTGYVEFADEAELLHGEVLDAIDVVTFNPSLGCYPIST
jgi:predicted HicB family RNase H-like nuclease